MRRALAALAAGACLAAGCGEAGAGADGRDELLVAAASSLKPALTEYAAEFRDARVRLSFAGSDELAAQIRQGLRPDVFAAADAALPGQLHEEGLLERPVAFAGNELVIVAPAGEDAVEGLGDLARRGLRLAVGAPGVPVGAYTRAMLGRAAPAVREGVLANVRSEEPDAAGVIGKVAQGAADAGFAYATDVAALRGEVHSIRLPVALRPDVVYAAGVVADAENPAAARRFVAGLVVGAGARALRRKGFRAPP